MCTDVTSGRSKFILHPIRFISHLSIITIPITDGIRDSIHIYICLSIIDFKNYLGIIQNFRSYWDRLVVPSTFRTYITHTQCLGEETCHLGFIQNRYQIIYRLCHVDYICTRCCINKICSITNINVGPRIQVSNLTLDIFVL